MIEKARKEGARLSEICALLEVSPRTFQRHGKKKAGGEDGRKCAQAKRAPANGLTCEEEAMILSTVNQPRFAALSPAHPSKFCNPQNFAKTQSFQFACRIGKNRTQDHWKSDTLCFRWVTIYRSPPRSRPVWSGRFPKRAIGAEKQTARGNTSTGRAINFMFPWSPEGFRLPAF